MTPVSNPGKWLDRMKAKEVGDKLGGRMVSYEDAVPSPSAPDHADTMLTFGDQQVAARELSAAQAIEWLATRGKSFRLSEDASQLWVDPKPDPLETWVVKDNARQMKSILARRKVEDANKEWDEPACAGLVDRAAKAIQGTREAIDRAKTGSDAAGAWNVVQIHLACMVDAIGARDRKELWRACDELVWLCGQIREWDGNGKKKT